MDSHHTPPGLWIWPNANGVVTHQGLDSEMFDHPSYPYFETLVREAIQNSLDARVDTNRPVSLKFTFHTEEIGLCRPYVEQLIQFRRDTKLRVPEEWSNGQISWLLIEDFNTHGLLGPRDKRESDFWHYWLNFGQSNKDGSGRGGRGIGRTAFLMRYILAFS